MYCHKCRNSFVVSLYLDNFFEHCVSTAVWSILKPIVLRSSKGLTNGEKLSMVG